MEAIFVRHDLAAFSLPVIRPTTPLTMAIYLAFARNGVILHIPYPMAAEMIDGARILEFFMH